MTAIDYTNPGEIDPSLLSVPGLVGALKDYTLKTAHLMGRTFRDAHDTRANLNIVALGGTAVGKEAARRTNKVLAHTIGADALAWVRRFVEFLTDEMLYNAQFWVAEGAFDRLKKRTIAILTAHGGQLDRSTLLRALHIDVQTFVRVIHTLHMCDQIEEELISRRKVIFTLKNGE